MGRGYDESRASQRAKRPVFAYSAAVLIGTQRTFAIALVLAMVPASARAQESEREAASQVHREGGYPTDITVLVPENSRCASDGGLCEDDMFGQGRGPRARSSGGGERTADPGMSHGGVPSWLRDFVQWLDALLSVTVQPLGWVLLTVLGVAMLALVGFFVARVRLSSRADSERDVDAPMSSPLDPLLQASGLRAEDLAAQGRYREAIHALFIEALEHVGALRGVHRARTARELVMMIPREHRGHAELTRLLDLTELVWFGGRPATEEQYRDAQVLCAAVSPLRLETTEANDE